MTWWTGREKTNGNSYCTSKGGRCHRELLEGQNASSPRYDDKTRLNDLSSQVGLLCVSSVFRMHAYTVFLVKMSELSESTLDTILSTVGGLKEVRN